MPHHPREQPAPPGRARRTLVIGCGNPLRGDDAVGMAVVRQLTEHDLPECVRCVDAGTSGLEVVLAMREVEQVVLIDAAVTPADGSPHPGTIHKWSPEDLSYSDLEGTCGVSTHALRWDQALALARTLAGPQALPPVRCYLIEGQSFGYGEPLSPPVAAAADALAARLAAELAAPPPPLAAANPATQQLRST